VTISTPRLYLITPVIIEPAAFVAPFEAVLAAGDIACVLLQTMETAIVRKFTAVTQQRGIACLVGDPRLAADTGCDGVHVDGVGPGLEAALAAMKPRGIVGVGGLKTRHDAMSAGETDVDYLMFGGPGEPFAEIRERTAWWAEIFNPPCVAYAQALDEVSVLASAGADFVALGDVVWNDPRGPAAAIEAAQRSLAAHEPAT
jgi:thiamine-phosphate pyrophosphorylase